MTQNNTRETRTIGGRRRLWDERPPITELLNAPVQGTAADIAKQALILLGERIAGSDGKIIGTVHDEIILEAPDDRADELAAILRNTMIEAGAVYLKRVPVDADVKIADSWAGK
jgi:DNA polymerase-1